MNTILFQGDSITDANRLRDCDDYRGFGYATLIPAKLGRKYPGEYCFINRGISGNRVVDLYARIKADFINLNPDYISILIGVNDVWHELGSGNGVDAAKFERIYSMLIEELKAALPKTKIMILEPFILKGAATEEKWDVFAGEVRLRAEASERVAEKYGLPFIKLQDKFDNAMTEYSDSSYWLIDGVHPTAMGHQIITDEWINMFEEEFLK